MDTLTYDDPPALPIRGKPVHPHPPFTAIHMGIIAAK